MYKDGGLGRKNLPTYHHHDQVDHRSEPPTLRGLTEDLDGDDAAMVGPDAEATSGKTPTGTSTGVSALVAVGATIGITFVVAVVILTVIFRLVRGQNHSPASTSSGSAELEVEGKTVRRQRQRGGTWLYYMPDVTATNGGGRLSAPASRTRLDVVATTADTDSARSAGETAASAAVVAGGRDSVTRSASSGEALRMYKWEDF